MIGVRLRSGEQVLADAVIAADGTYSPVKRGLNLVSRYHGHSAIAIRAEMPANRPDADSLDIYLKLTYRGDQLPGYGWVFPLGGGRVNIGLGYANSYRSWHQINSTELLATFIAGMPREWELPPLSELKESRGVRGWRLPMGFTAWPPWRPGVLFAGDALGAARPSSGAGISKALQSGMAAGECAIASLTNGGPDDFTNYQQRIADAWGAEYRRGRLFHKVVGVPAFANAGRVLLDRVSHPWLQSRLLFWEGWGDPRRTSAGADRPDGSRSSR